MQVVTVLLFIQATKQDLLHDFLASACTSGQPITGSLQPGSASAGDQTTPHCMLLAWPAGTCTCRCRPQKRRWEPNTSYIAPLRLRGVTETAGITGRVRVSAYQAVSSTEAQNRLPFYCFCEKKLVLCSCIFQSEMKTRHKHTVCAMFLYFPIIFQRFEFVSFLSPVFLAIKHVGSQRYFFQSYA
jgi:hypothetical protein